MKPTLLTALALTALLATSCRAQPLDGPGMVCDPRGRGLSPTDYLSRIALYTTEDSARVERLLATEPQGNDVLFYARQFLGQPYVAHTLEVADPERVVVNMRGLDCTTLVETACALALTRRKGLRTFHDYCTVLELIRYRNQRCEGYLSRLHYFAWWMKDNIRAGIVSEVTDKKHWTAPMTVRNHYMTRHPDQYRMLTLHPEWLPEITRMEQEGNGPDGHYLPQQALTAGQRELGAIRDGDIIAIVTTKDGLDYSHLGIAFWDKTDGRLHMLHASSAYKRVVADRTPLHKYLAERRTSVGIRVLRLR
ncbi:MAG: DUF1460 domain-containing protein [Prevotella sp.]|nr:DUF1460 domain-containing protein [Prevotella sp.]